MLVRAVSDAIKRRKETPAAEKLAVVVRALALEKVTEPGAVTTDQFVVSTLPAGRPSSVALPVRLADAGSVMV